MNSAQQQLQQAQVQAVQQLLQAPLQVGTQKLLINVNGGDSKIITNKNSIIKYTLEQPVKLDIGDRVTLVESFVEERGLSVDTITFDKDVVEEMRFLYYKQGDCENVMNVAADDEFSNVIGQDQNFAPFPQIFPDVLESETQENFTFCSEASFELYQELTQCSPTRNHITQAATDNEASVAGPGFSTVGSNGQYYYLMETYNPYQAGHGNSFTLNSDDPNDNPNQKFYFRPLYGQATIRIPAGNYSVSALSDLINNQLNGSRDQNNRFNSNAMIEKLFYNKDNLGFIKTSPFFNDLNATNESELLDPAIYNPDSLIIGPDTYQPFQRRRGDMIAKIIFNSATTGNFVNMKQLAGRANGQTSVPGEDVWSDTTSSLNATGSTFRAATKLGINDDPSYWNKTSVDRIKYKQFNSNFYMHLGGLKGLFTEGYYYDNTDITEFSPEKIPNFRDLFLCNIGDEGMYYTAGDLTRLNYQPDGVNIKRYWDANPEQFNRFSCLFPVAGASGGFDPNNTSLEAVTIGNFQQFAGTTSFEIGYDEGNTNRFTISNLHEPYKMPSCTPDGTADTNLGGQQATMYNSPTSFAFGEGNFNIDPIYQVCGLYPVEAVSGLAVNNFAFNTVKTTDIYKNLVEEISDNNTANAFSQLKREKLIFDLFTKPFDKFYSNTDLAKEAWSTTFWSRLGYTYEQLGDVSNNLEEIFTFNNIQRDGDELKPIVNPKTVKQMGIISHNDFDFTQIPSSSGLGAGNYYSSKAHRPQGYNLRGYTATVDTSATGRGDDKHIVEGVFQNYVHILANSKNIIADDFPSLNQGNNYLVIESDIVRENAKDSLSTPTTIVGIVSKENAANDTIFSQNDYSFVVTEPRLLSTIEVRIKNPDGTLVSDSVIGKNSGFVFQVERALKPAAIPLQSI